VRLKVNVIFQKTYWILIASKKQILRRVNNRVIVLDKALKWIRINKKKNQGGELEATRPIRSMDSYLYSLYR